MPIRSYPSFRQILSALVVCIILGFAFGELYAVGQVFIGGPSWVVPCLINSLLAVVVMALALKGALPRPSYPSIADQPGWWRWLNASRWRVYLPSLIILIGVLGLALLTRLALPTATQQLISAEYLVFVLWIPIVEELVFRVGISAYFRKRLGIIWGCYFSALLFALVHTQPTVAAWLNWQIGLPLGPLLLGLANEAIYVSSGRIIPAIVLHAVCNLTVVIFAIVDSRWLSWLSPFYLP